MYSRVTTGAFFSVPPPGGLSAAEEGGTASGGGLGVSVVWWGVGRTHHIASTKVVPRYF